MPPPVPEGVHEPNGADGAALSVRPDLDGLPLLEFLSCQLIGESKTRLRRLIGSGAIRLNGTAATPRRTVHTADVVTLPPGLEHTTPPRQALAIRVIYEDDALLCIDKPAGHPVLPARGGRDAELFQSLLALLNRDAPPGGPYRRPHVVHRLDRETSGTLLVAKTVQAGRALSRQFEQREVEKVYLALIEGVLPRAELTVDAPLSRMTGSALKMAPARRGGKPAVTHMRLLERFGHFSVVEARPKTGRQHQIRVHLAATGYPLAVDVLYGRRTRLTASDLSAIVGRRATSARGVLLARCPLHAATIAYRHPLSGGPMRHQAPCPADLASLLDLLREADPPA